MQFFADFWYVWVACTVLGAVSWYLYRKLTAPKPGEVQAQFVVSGCLAIFAFIFQFSTIIMAICSVLGLILRFLQWRHH